MLIKFKLDLGALADGVSLPKKKEAGLVCYEIVIKNCNTPVLRIPFCGAGKFDVELYSHDVVINPDRINLSSTPHIARVRDIAEPIEFHCNKVLLKNGRVNYRNRGACDTSERQHVPFLVWENPGTDAADCKYVCDLAIHLKASLLDIIPSETFSSNGIVYRWRTQRNFYQTSHVTRNDETHRRNVEIILEFLARVKAKTPLSFLIKFGSEMLNRLNITFEEDVCYADAKKECDSGSDHLEVEGVGDCEDFAHFFMRAMRTLFAVAEFAPSLSTSNAELIKELKNTYVPLVCICQIKQQRTLCFHSTIMLLPKSNSHPVISFEVTEPRKSYVLPDAEYSHWHNNVYYFVDNYFIADYTQTGVDITKLTLRDLKLKNY